jgi:apolipoprotein N-acyltransferase
MVFLIALFLSFIYPSMMFSATSLWGVAIPPTLWWAAALRKEPSLSVFEGKKGPSSLSVAAAGFGTVLVLYVWIRLSMMDIIY